MVPLTGSMYVPGTIADSENVIIDVGTGYYLQKDIDGAKDYFKRKVTFVTEQMEKIQAVGMEKSKIREGIHSKFYKNFVEEGLFPLQHEYFLITLFYLVYFCVFTKEGWKSLSVCDSNIYYGGFNFFLYVIAVAHSFQFL
ncbi:putative prefoldin subunit 5 isoform X1 [Lycorma delicatula]